METYLQFRALKHQLQAEFEGKWTKTQYHRFSSAGAHDSLQTDIEDGKGESTDQTDTSSPSQQSTEKEFFVVDFQSLEDPLRPRNWSVVKRALYTANVGIIALVVGTAASIDSAVIPNAAAEFGVSEIVEALATGLFLIGFGVGALIAGPLSETVGRNAVYFGSLLIYMLFLVGAATSPTLAGQLVCRFLAGFFGESPLSTVGGSISDMWEPLDRLIAFPIFATLGLMGPLMGPIIGGWIAGTDVISWRWTEWVALIMSGLLLASLVLFQPETYEPILLRWKAHHLRKMTGDHRYVAPSEVDGHTFRKRMATALSRPFAMLIQEPVIMLWTAYLTVIYIMLFGFLDGYSFVFGDTYRLSPGLTGLIFVGMAIGLVLASLSLTPLVLNWAKRDITRMQESIPDQPPRLPSEFFLWYSMIGAPAIPISLFWMGWTAFPSISIWSPILASVLFGYGILSVFVSTYMYLIDSYETFAASALTMITLVRYVASGGMVEASIPMYRNLGVHWALTLLACIGVVFTTVPYLFYAFGPKIRARSKFAKGHDR
ncbi:hypothetical protein Plec18167_004785 [Paecilomyces lecythidis]|uniref:Major facilitator superfamily (MFS) profile domain-containing protein n=1 Tax=Paecilomyces lecythidis TaxID=3004212 RepID=A0ABR3XPB0_9EURO